jgi:hypothetical protein
MSTNKSPSHIAYTVKEFGDGKKKKSKWTPIGAAWAHANGEGFNIQLDAFPIDGKIVLRVYEPDEASESGQERSDF